MQSFPKDSIFACKKKVSGGQEQEEVHSISSYPGTLGPGTARISDMPITQNRTHTLQITYDHY